MFKLGKWLDGLAHYVVLITRHRVGHENMGLLPLVIRATIENDEKIAIK